MPDEQPHPWPDDPKDRALWLAGVEFASSEARRFSAQMMALIRVDGQRDAAIFEQAIGCEMLAARLSHFAAIIGRRTESESPQEESTPTPLFDQPQFPAIKKNVTVSDESRANGEG